MKKKSYSKIVKRIIKNRDGNECFFCKGTQNLTVAHIFTWRKDGGLPIVENGMTLCRKCHDKMDFGIGCTKKEQIKMLEICKMYLSFSYMIWEEEMKYEKNKVPKKFKVRK